MKKHQEYLPGILIGILMFVIGYAVSTLTRTSSDLTEVSPDMYRPVFENEHVRALEFTLEPGQTESMHTHSSPAVIYYMKDADYVHTTEEGVAHHVSVKAGEAVWRERVTHEVTNTGTTDVNCLVVEIKLAREH